jgi:lipopolysaccharide/colanic/teichoic acid biosynthesis glycosyltransferase
MATQTEAMSDHTATAPALGVSRAAAPHAGYEVAKRALDVVAAFALLIVASPALLAIALAVKWTSPGPVFFRQERYGLGGQPFSMLKFRTMVADAEQQAEALRAAALNGEIRAIDAPAFKSADDPRVTAVGRVLRRYSLDEIPQFLNVLKGDMTLVGPRPLVAAEALRVPADATVRHSVKPGLTCIWQTSGRSRVSYDERMAMDVEYVRTRSLKLDLILLLKTPLAAIRGDGAF